MKIRVVLLCLFITSVTSAQRYDILSGDFKNLKGISEYNVVFDYSNLKVAGFDTEEAFLKDKMDKRKNVEGKAEKFKEDWFSNRKLIYEPKYMDYFNKRFVNGEVKISENNLAKYTMKVKVAWIYPGYTAEPAKMTAIVTFYETNNPTNILMEVKFDKLIGIEVGVFANVESERITGAYEKLAKNLTLQMKRFL